MRVRLVCIGICSALLAAPPSAHAGWLTAITDGDETYPVSALQLEDIQDLKQGNTGPRLIDLTVSLYKKATDEQYPRGDNDGSTQGKPGSEEQDKYENIFKYAADAIYEMSEGKQKLRNVRIFRKGARANDANIIWTEKGHPKAHVNGVADTSGHIYMYDIFQGGAAGGGDHDLLADPEGAGYTVGHEMGHFWFGVYDEYSLQAGDVPVKKSVMNSQWSAKGAKPDGFDWLNFSVAFQQADPTGDWINTKVTAQHRKLGESAWETLKRNPATDPKDGDLNATLKRAYYSELAAAAPSGTNKPVRNLTSKATTTDARSDLKVIWVTDFAYEIVLDRSGSMAGSPLANAKAAAKLLVDLAKENETKIGVVVFDDTVQTLTPVTQIRNAADKNTIKAQIDLITDGFSTAIGEGAAAALNELNAATTASDIKAVFLLSDGVSNSGRDPLSVIPAYRNSQVPIFAFAYGSGADTNTMRAMAAQTGGELFVSPTDLASVTSAFQRANQAAQGLQQVRNGAGTASSGSPGAHDFVVDSTVERVVVSVVIAGGALDADVRLVGPSGQEVLPDSSSQSSLETLLTFVLEQPEVGAWSVEIDSQTGFDVPYSYQISAAPDGIQYAVKLQVQGGNALTYPQPMLVVATVERELPIRGATVTATVTDPFGEITDLTLADNGISPDETPNDGRYSGIVFYDTDGTYRIDASANNIGVQALLTEEHLQVTATLNGSLPPFTNPIPINEPFERSATTEVTVEGVDEDDHGDDFFSATDVTPDNTDVDGWIEVADDVDAFAFTAPEGATAMTARVSGLAGLLEPLLTVYDTAGVPVAEGTLATAASQDGYVFLNFAVTAGETYFATVRHEFDDGNTGLYKFSAGSALPFDILPLVEDGCGCNGEKSGGEIALANAPVTLLTLLALVAMGRRRRRPQA